MTAHRTGRLAFAFVTLLFMSPAAFAQAPARVYGQSNGLCDPANIHNCLRPNSDGSLPVSGNVGIAGAGVPFAASPTASIARPANTTTYTANTGWNNATSAATGYFSFTGACRSNGGQVLIPEIDIWSSKNPATPLQGIVWLFAGVPGTNINDDATFNITAADFANLTGSQSGFAFALAAPQAAGAANSGVSLTGTTYQAQCAAGTTIITGMVQVSNAYVPASGELLNVTLHTIGAN